MCWELFVWSVPARRMCIGATRYSLESSGNAWNPRKSHWKSYAHRSQTLTSSVRTAQAEHPLASASDPPAIRHVSIAGTSLITVENLTTYHDEPVCQNAIVYLGGFHNSIRTDLLKLIYADNYDKKYFHKGDIDVFGFVILENLKKKTGIPFLQTLLFCSLFLLSGWLWETTRCS